MLVYPLPLRAAASEKLLAAKCLCARNPEVLQSGDAHALAAAVLGRQLRSDCAQHLHGNVHVLKLQSVARECLVRAS